MAEMHASLEELADRRDVSPRDRKPACGFEWAEVIAAPDRIGKPFQVEPGRLTWGRIK
jgi:hypothetical protein